MNCEVALWEEIKDAVVTKMWVYFFVFPFRICLFLMEGGGDMNMCHAAHGSQNIPQESVFSSYEGSRDHTQGVRFDCLHLHLLNYAVSPFF